MDTSKEYIKMCEKAAEIQLPVDANFRKHFKKGDFFTGRLDVDAAECDIAADGYYVWLPRQDQLQEMIKLLGPSRFMLCYT